MSRRWSTNLRRRLSPTWHPAALLRDENKKIEFWKDLKLLKDVAEEENLAI